MVEGATIFISGANRGLGASLVTVALAGGAARVYAAARDTGALAVDDPRVTPVALDLLSEGSIAAAAAACADTDILINNAAFLANASALRAESLDEARREMDTNYWGIVLMTRLFAPVLAARGGGTIVNILSMGALASVPFCSSYCAAKAAAWSFTQSANAELAPEGVRVMAVFPGPIATAMARGGEHEGRIPPEDVAAATFAALAGKSNSVFPDPISLGVGQMVGEVACQVPSLFAARVA